jgi:hypothetical protein
MQKRGLARWVGGRQRLAEKGQKTLIPTEAPPKLHRNIRLTTPELPRSSPAATRLQQDGGWVSAPEPDGGGLGSWRS